MKAYLRFDLPDDEWNFRLSCDAVGLHSAIREFSDSLRKMRKYESDSWDGKTLEAVHQAWQEAVSDLNFDRY